jgi:hypothetical protein
MSASVFETKKSGTPKSKRRAPASNENAQPPRSKRSLSDRIRNLFGRDSSVKTRTTSNDPLRPSSNRNSATGESPQLRAPGVQWPKKTNKKKGEPTRPMEISNPINPYSSSIQGETFVPRTPTSAGFREQPMIIDDRPRQVKSDTMNNSENNNNNSRERGGGERSLSDINHFLLI